jgi:hypothetical protein
MGEVDKTTRIVVGMSDGTTESFVVPRAVAGKVGNALAKDGADVTMEIGDREFVLKSCEGGVPHWVGSIRQLCRIRS